MTVLCSARLHISCCCSGKSPWNSCRQVYANLSSQPLKKPSKFQEWIERGQTSKQKRAQTLLKWRVNFLFFVTRQVNRCVLKVTIQLCIDWFNSNPIQFKNSRPREWQKSFPPQNWSFLRSHCKLLLQALAAVGFTASYLKRIVIDVSYHNYQETSSFWENSLVSSPYRAVSVSAHNCLWSTKQANIPGFFDMEWNGVLFKNGLCYSYKLTLETDMWQMTLHVQIICLKTVNFNVNFY